MSPNVRVPPRDKHELSADDVGEPALLGDRVDQVDEDDFAILRVLEGFTDTRVFEELRDVVFEGIVPGRVLSSDAGDRRPWLNRDTFIVGLKPGSGDSSGRCAISESAADKAIPREAPPWR